MVHLDWSRVRLRCRLDTTRGRPREFLFQIEFNHGNRTHWTDDPSDWREVARMEHDESGPHDAREEGLHMDVYDRTGTQVMKVWDFPRVQITAAPDFCERFLKRNWQELVDQYENGWPRYD